jgi:predicted phosphodiesterase
MEREGLFEKVGSLIEKEPRLIRLPSQGKAVFVGDTHGDLEATEEVIRRYLKKPYRIVFLGDYVDRGNRSEENIHFLLGTKLRHPDGIFLLSGNHEGFQAKPFYPVNFWESLSPEEVEVYGALFSKFPLATTTENGILALHGGLPDLPSLDEVNGIEWGGSQWDRIVWGDFVEREGEHLGDWGGRPQFGRSYFKRLMGRYRKRILIRSHQPFAPIHMFHKSCLTIFTSHAYLPVRTIAIADLEEEIKSVDDITLDQI